MRCLKKETESKSFTARDHGFAFRDVPSLCRLCGVADETVAHIVAECLKVTQMEYKQVRYDYVARVIHWKLCEKWGAQRAGKWYMHKPEKALKSHECKILWDFPFGQLFGTYDTRHYCH